MSQQRKFNRAIKLHGVKLWKSMIKAKYGVSMRRLRDPLTFLTLWRRFHEDAAKAQAEGKGAP